RSAVLVNGAGMKLASAPLAADEAQGSLAAMSSSALAIGAAMLEDAGLGACQDIVIEARDGMIVLLRVGDADPLLSVVTDHTAMLGEVLWAARRCCQLLGTASPAQPQERRAGAP
ncbi:MAG: roadblock/LC7 domain-containing protein, partial [Burkholderiaceae bacterium]